ncbi:hypothetical protein GCM10011369_26740 [Neiella marina]|uniref:Uncharacterized protein n=1 Tax=Neiella marina TaxID=508461 RepID=A0A8J2U752_9GAMM|nr:hypothetical protein GCM10011369_26740 [Neiella marina]
MEAHVALLLVVIVSIAVAYLMPLIVQRLKTRKVKIVVDAGGAPSTSIVYLYPDDPLWKAIEHHKRSKSV